MVHNQSSIRGWGRPRSGKKWHYFDYHRYSLCNRWEVITPKRLIAGPTSGTDYDCFTCVARYERGLFNEDDDNLTLNEINNDDIDEAIVIAVSHAPSRVKKKKSSKNSDDTEKRIRRSHGPRKFSKYRGVSWHVNGKWQANLKFNSKGIYLGLFYTEEDAARAYDDAVREHLGADGYERLNFKEKTSTS